MENFSTIISIIGIIVGILTLFFVGKILFKYVGRDDKSVTFGDHANVKDSFNKETSFIKKQK